MRILAFSDLHRDRLIAGEILAASPAADVVVGCGDLATLGEGLGDCLEALLQIRVPLILVAGNHERLADLKAACSPREGVHVLHGDGITLAGVTFFGLGYEIPGTGKPLTESQMDEAAAARLLAPYAGGGVLLTHSPPLGVADLQRDGSNRGSRSIRAAIERGRPRLHLCGHIHNAWGSRGHVAGSLVHNLGPTLNWHHIDG